MKRTKAEGEEHIHEKSFGSWALSCHSVKVYGQWGIIIPLTCDAIIQGCLDEVVTGVSEYDALILGYLEEVVTCPSISDQWKQLAHRFSEK